MQYMHQQFRGLKERLEVVLDSVMVVFGNLAVEENRSVSGDREVSCWVI